MTAFLIDELPVTNRDFKAFVDAGGYGKPACWTPLGWSYIRENGISAPNYWNDPVWNVDAVPVTGISWWEALAYARFVNKTLPTESQWEYACRGADGRTFPWGEDEPTLDLANFAPMCEPVERRPTDPYGHPRNVSPFGCRDMVGNFAEWCLDNYRPSYLNEDGDCDPLYIGAEEDEHVTRGGSGLHSADYLRASSRDCYPPSVRDNLIGLRCVGKP